MTHLIAHSVRRLIATRIAVVLVAVLCAFPAQGQTPSERTSSTLSTAESALADIDGLGAISFPNSGAVEAQDSFYRGVLLLHSFEYSSAAAAFRRAQELDPDFALAFWGEAMTYNHPLWRAYDRDAGQAALKRLAPTHSERRLKAKTEREALYLDAVETLYSFDGAKYERDQAYMAAMKSLTDSYPDDDEARTFYALAILGSQDGAREFATYMRGAATALPVFERNPRHPGAAHYVIHSFDDPIHAPLGLPAADAYADIAPDAAHAQHMTSHIFLALGLWGRTIAANIRARDTQDAASAAQGGRKNVCGHYSSWLHYAYLQVGETATAETLMDECYERVQGDAKVGEWDYFVGMRARHLMDTEVWSLSSRWTVQRDRLPAAEGGWGYGVPELRYRITDAFVGIQLGDDSAARSLVSEPRPEAPGAALQIDQLDGLLLISDGKTEEGLALLSKAAAEEDALPLEFGPPELVKPTFELLGRTLLDLGRQTEAVTAFRRAVERTPGRPLAVNGLDEAQN